MIERKKKYKPFECINKINSDKLLLVLQNEHPQTIACVLAHLKPRKAADIIKKLPDSMQGDIILRITALDKINPDLLYDIENELVNELSAISKDYYTDIGGLTSTIKILKSIGKKYSNYILNSFKKDDRELVQILKSKL